MKVLGYVRVCTENQANEGSFSRVFVGKRMRKRDM